MLKLVPAYQDYIWGGVRLKEEYGKDTGLSIVAESWELSVHENGKSRISGGEYDGMTLDAYLRLHPEAVGADFTGEDAFPILVKLIDAKQSLSVQVHPDDAYAMRHAHSPGKTELWYILEAEPDAFLYLGVERDITREEFAARIRDNTVERVLRRCPVRPGEAYMVEAGTLHAIGAGILLAEIQQSSDVTYRVYDFGRLGPDGKPRPLHIEQALEVSCFSAKPQLPVGAKAVEHGVWLIAACPYFTIGGVGVRGVRPYAAPLDSFKALLCIEGRCKAGELPLKKGDTLFMPAGERCILEGEARLLTMGRGGR